VFSDAYYSINIIKLFVQFNLYTCNVICNIMYSGFSLELYFKINE